MADDTEARHQRSQRAERLSELADLRARVVQLEAEITELTGMNERLSRVADAVAEALLPADQRDDQRLRQLLARHQPADE